MIQVSPKARDFLSRVGYDPHFGARPLKRAIQIHLLNPLATLLLEGQVRENSEISVDYQEGTLNQDGEETLTIVGKVLPEQIVETNVERE